MERRDWPRCVRARAARGGGGSLEGETSKRLLFFFCTMLRECVLHACICMRTHVTGWGSRVLFLPSSSRVFRSFVGPI